jgi:hypothetical protein
MGTPSIWYRLRQWLAWKIFPEIWRDYEQIVQEKWELEDAFISLAEQEQG